MSSDLKQVVNLATNVAVKDELRYPESQFDYIIDESSTTYATDASSCKIVFDTTPMSSRFINFANSYISIPLNIYNASYASTNIVALKQSVLSLISGLVVTTTNGTSIINQPSSNYWDIYSNIKLMSESSTSDAEDLKEILFLSKDEGINYTAPLLSSYQGYINATRYYCMTGTTATNALDPSVAYVTNATSTGTYGQFNAGLAYRKKKTMVGLASNTFKLHCHIPLKYIHEFFAQLDYPLLGGNFRIEITMNTALRSLVSYTSTSDLTALTPTMKITSITDTNAGTRTRLYCNTVTLPAEVLSQELKELQSGKTRVFKFRDPIVYKHTALATTAVSDVITQSVVKPVRAFILGFDADRTLAGDAIGMVNPNIRFSSLNLKVNGMPLFKQPMNTLPQMWKEFQRACAQKDNTVSKVEHSYINYDDFENQYRINAIDLSGVKKLLSSETTPCFLEIDGTRTEATSCDLLCYVDREMVCTLKLNGKQMDILVSQ